MQWRLATFVFTVFLGALPLVMLGSPLGPDNPLTTGIAIAAGVVWVRRRAAVVVPVADPPTVPRRTTSSVRCAPPRRCLVLSSPYAGLMGCTIFAVIGGFLAYFHVIAHVIGNCALALICAAITAAGSSPTRATSR